jgi:hypothetical protein
LLLLDMNGISWKGAGSDRLDRGPQHHRDLARARGWAIERRMHPVAAKAAGLSHKVRPFYNVMWSFTMLHKR